ncbi:hypothetical protein BJ508DRAFT_413567 [Ascobolus immersus RN42]|uniref:Uncharacterized protein n=1 Tax=Ascobolus immersus RN42 TaxID=1160509 RepID=A0A3N4IGR4_ASCIM|nr:hypothetical protein BJ508DRAFT_413567 [Ascobolus immersus RN42]
MGFFYLKFLKPPQLAPLKGPSGSFTLTTVFTITSDLGDVYFTDSIDIRATLSSGSAILLEKTISWTNGSQFVRCDMPFQSSKIPSTGLSGLVLSLSPVPSEVEGRLADGIDELCRIYPDPSIQVVSASSSQTKLKGKNLFAASHLVERRLKLRTTGDVLKVWEETGENIAGHVWDAGIILSAYLDHYADKSSGPLTKLHSRLNRKEEFTAIELGSGCGLVGLTLATVYPKSTVFLTDLSEAEELCRRNLELVSTTTSGVDFCVLDWYDTAIPETIPKDTADIILAADCTYNTGSVPALVKTFERLTENNRDAVVLLAHKPRHDSERLFFELMEDNFDIVERTDAALPKTSDWEDEDDGGQLPAQAVNLYTFKRK